MALASTSNVSLAFKEEVTYGVIPAGTPKYLRHTGEDLSFDFTTETSKEINATRQTPDSILTNASAAGGFNFELSYTSFDAFFEALLAGTFFDTPWDTASPTAVTVDIVAAAGTITDNGVDGFAAFPAAPFTIKIANAVAAGNNGNFLVASRTDDVLTIDATTPLSANATADAVSIVPLTGVETLTVSMLTPENTITDDGVDGFANLPAAPFWIRLVETVAGTNTGNYLVVNKTSDVLTVSSLTPIIADAAAKSCTISHSRLSNGTATQRSFCIEKGFTDVNQFFMHKGRVPSKLDLNFATGAIVTGTLGFVGSTAPRADATQFAAAPSAATSYGIMNAVTGVGALSIKNGGTELVTDTFVNSMKVSIDAALREQKAIGTLGAVGVGAGAFKISGTMEIYLKTGAIYDAALASSLLTVTFPVYDALGNGYGFVFDNVKLKVPKVVAGSMDADVMLSVEFTAVAPNTSTNRMIHIDRFGAAV